MERSTNERAGSCRSPWRIDVHHHIIPDKYSEVLIKKGISQPFGVTMPSWEVDDTLHFMERNEIASVIFSVSSPGVFFGDITEAISLSRMVNETITDIIAQDPGCFGAFATLPLPDTHASLKELEYSLDTLKMDGIALLSNVNGYYLGDPRFNELFEELNHRRAVVFIHPEVPPGYGVGHYNLPPVLIDVPYDTTRAVLKLLFTGTLLRCPNIRFVLAHSGGTVPFLAFRITLGEYHDVYKEAMKQMAPEGIITYLKRFFYETALSASPYALGSLSRLVDVSHIVFGSDYPFAPEKITALSLQNLEGYEGFSNSDLQKIERENALSLFPRLAAQEGISRE